MNYFLPFFYFSKKNLVSRRSIFDNKFIYFWCISFVFLKTSVNSFRGNFIWVFCIGNVNFAQFFSPFVGTVSLLSVMVLVNNHLVMEYFCRGKETLLLNCVIKFLCFANVKLTDSTNRYFFGLVNKIARKLRSTFVCIQLKQHLGIIRIWEFDLKNKAASWVGAIPTDTRLMNPAHSNTVLFNQDTSLLGRW